MSGPRTLALATALSDAERSWLDDETVRPFDGRMSQAENTAPRFEPRPYWLADLLSDPELLKPPHPIVPRLCWKGQLSMLAGREKSGKSTVARAGAARVSSGAPFLGEATEEAKVLYCSLEESLSTVARSLKEHGANPDNVLVVSSLSDKNDERAQWLSDTIVEHDFKLVVIDTLLAYAPEIEDANSAAKMQRVVLALAHVAHDTQAAILMLHHAKKADGRYRDSSAIGGAVDVILEMMEPEESDTLRVVKGRGRFELADFRFRYVNGEHVLAVADAEGVGIEARVYDFVFGNPESSLRQVRIAIGGRNERVDQALGTLVRAGKIENTGSGRSRRYRVPRINPQRDFSDV